MLKTESSPKKESKEQDFNLNFEDKKRICHQIENAQHSVLIKIYNTIIKENPELPIKKTKKGILFSFNKLNSVSLSKIVDILDKENEEKDTGQKNTNCSGNLTENNMFGRKKHINLQDKDLIFYLLEKNKKQPEPPLKEIENKSKRKVQRKKKEIKKQEINYKSDDSIDLYIKTSSKNKIETKKLSDSLERQKRIKNSLSTEQSDNSDWSDCPDSKTCDSDNSTISYESSDNISEFQSSRSSYSSEFSSSDSETDTEESDSVSSMSSADSSSKESEYSLISE